MGYGKLAKGVSPEEARKRLEQVMPATSGSKEFSGASPPSIFVGSYNYPKVNTGVLSPQFAGDSSRLDSPRDWYREGYGIERIASLRTSLVNSKKRQEVTETGGFLTDAQEVAMARKPVEVEVSLDREPRSQVSGGRVKPVSAVGDVEDFSLAENPSVERKVEKAFYDTDLKAENAVTELYGKGVDTYSLKQSFSAGMLGEEENRKMVPTRWSITATDDIVSKKLRSEVKQRQELGQVEYYMNSYVGNVFHIFLVPGRWEYELVELKRSGSVWNASRNTYIAQNYEPYSGRTQYAEETAGAYYASRLGVLEHLQQRKRQAKALVVREVTPEYWAPLGVWVIREAVRNAFEDSNVKELDSFEDVKWAISRNFRFLYDRIRRESKMLQGRQLSLADY